MTSGTPERVGARRFFADVAVNRTEECVLASDYDALAHRVEQLEAALSELVAAEEAPYPFSEQGAAAQAAWSERRHKAREAAKALLSGVSP